MVGRDAFFVLDFCLHILNGVARLDFKRDGLSGQGFHEDLHSATKTQHQMKGGLLLNIIVAQSATIFQLLSSEDQPLLVGRDAFFVLDFCLHILNGVARLDFKRDGLSGQGFHEDLHSATKTQHQM